MKCQKCDREEDLILLCPVCDSCIHSVDEAKGHFSRETDDRHCSANPFSEISLDRLNEILETTVKQDRISKSIVLFGMLLAQTEEDQFNVMFSASSSTGKTYIPSEIAAYFPSNEIVEYAGASPTSFFHENGVWVVELEDRYVSLDELVEPIRKQLEALKEENAKDVKARIRELEKEIRELTSRAKILVDEESKIIILADQPNTQLLGKLRPVLSHDKKHIEIPITDAAGHGGKRTKHVIFRGYATFIFCTVKSEFDEQESNRNFVLSPESDLAKIEKSLALLDEKLSNREIFREKLERDPDRRALRFRIQLIRASGIKRIVTDSGIILQKFRELHNFLNPRATRDFNRLYSLVFGDALLNGFNRDSVDSETIRATFTDIDAAFELFKPIMDSNESGVSPELYALLKDILIPAYIEKNQGLAAKGESLGSFATRWTGLYYQEIMKEYRTKYHRSTKYDKLREDVKSLVSAGLVTEEQGEDKRKPAFCPVLTPEAMNALAQSGVQNTLAINSV